MTDIEAEHALDAYRRTIRVYRNPERHAPEFPAIFQALRDAEEYFQEIPQGQMTLDQFRLAGEIRSILIRRRESEHSG